jgi:signal transduction histidine kinase
VEASLDGNRLARLTRPMGTVLWVVVAATVIARRWDSPRFSIWAGSWALGFAASLTHFAPRLPRLVSVGALAVEALMVAWMTAQFLNGFEGLLLVPLALELWFRLRPFPAALGSAVFTVPYVLGAAYHYHWDGWAACTLTLPYVAMQGVMMAASVAFDRETALRAELTALRPLLEEGSRNAERVRLSRDLHDATGHKLTALALQLEVASHVATGAADEPVRTARVVVSELIDDMHRIVTATDRTDSEGLASALRELARNFPRPRVHLALPERLHVADAERAHVLLRCSQEILTNSARHSGAANLWLEITQSEAELQLRARDDGTVSDELHAGAGLRGMRSRFEDLGGTLRYESAPQGGLQIFASLPNPPG